MAQNFPGTPHSANVAIEAVSSNPVAKSDPVVPAVQLVPAISNTHTSEGQGPTLRCHQVIDSCTESINAIPAERQSEFRFQLMKFIHEFTTRD